MDITYIPMAHVFMYLVAVMDWWSRYVLTWELSMDGRGRWIDNRFIGRQWRSVKYEDIYINDYGDGLSAGRGLGKWFEKYNHQRPHQSLENATPADWYQRPQDFAGQPATWEAMRARNDGRRGAENTSTTHRRPQTGEDF
jgi:putative transposase